MSNTTQEVLTVEGINQYGIKVGGKTYSISTRLAGQGVTPQHFAVGSRIRAEIWTGPQGGKKINSFQVEGAAAPVAYAPAPVAAPAYVPPMPPMLPQTNVASTSAPGGIPPVAKAPRASAPVVATEDKMSKADWAARNGEIAIQAIVKSSLESPALGEHVTGKSTPEFMQMTRDFIKFNLQTYRMAVDGTL